ncbi:MAG: AsnC family transcriptional regulator [Alphaproteobacteria bacterium]|jgi:DNA-binding Lrp family transcriptional regulator|nr:protein nirH [Rhodospirillaceae bacterium]MAG97338.1 protein nirH [Rhodospirillaceae bacterium]MDP6406868.1 AsnC family transcriptional regulator [Alphaproteobacteria bacterium]MDP6623292.1 AsnC family transcriptional regulator [Alphaproteobacteria bacterium]
MAALDAVDRRLLVATQGGLPLVAEPYAAVAEAVGIAPDEVQERLRAMLESGVVRRIGVVPNHYALGFKANGMSVWDVPDSEVAALGPEIGGLDYVSHCYRRPRRAGWPYNLFAMVHGRDRDEVEAKVADLADRLAGRSRRHKVLYSTRILKKTGLRIAS